MIKESNINNVTMNDKNTITNSFNPSIHIHVEDRSNLKERNDGREYEYDMFCIGRYKNDKAPLHGYIRVTCINVHSNYKFITDHIHVNIPEKMFDENDSYSLMKVKGIVYEYTRTNGTKDYSMKVTQILNISNRIMGAYKNTFGVKFNKLDNNVIESCMKILEDLENDQLSELVIREVESIDSLLSAMDMFLPGFISDSIFTYYFLNNKISYLTQQKLCVRYLNNDVLIDLAKLFSTLIKGINDGEIFMWRQLFKKVSEICNVLQGVEKDTSKYTKSKRSDYDKTFDNIREFSNKIDSDEVKKNFEKIRIRNKDFGYLYPEDVNSFKSELKNNLISYALCRGYLKIENIREEI